MALLSSFAYTFLNKVFHSQALLEKLKDYISPEDGVRLLDAGCGTGMMREICSPCNYVGIDLEEDRVAELKQSGFDGELICGSLLDLPFSDESFDIILVSGVLHHLSDSECALAFLQFSRVLKNGGHVVLFEPIWPLNKLNLLGWFIQKFDDGKFVRYTEDWKNMVNDGFNIEREENFYYRGLDSYIVKLTKK